MGILPAVGTANGILIAKCGRRTWEESRKTYVTYIIGKRDAASSSTMIHTKIADIEWAWTRGLLTLILETLQMKKFIAGQLLKKI